MAALRAAVHVRDPQSGRPVVLLPGEEPAPHLAALVPDPDCWVDGVLPDSRPAEDDGEGEDEGEGSADTGGSSTPDTPLPDPDQGDDNGATKPAAAKKAAAKRPARGRKAAVEGDGGQ